MSKGSLYWGKGRGKLGETVLSINKGQQITRAYNATPANPKTRAQMRQRAKLANCVKFYKQVTDGCFKFAYNDKKPLESDYNAFMRHNITAGTLLNRAMVDNPAMPAFGSFMVSRGLLGEVRLTEDPQNNLFGLYVVGAAATSSLTTIGDFSKDVIATYPALKEGDIVTIFIIYAVQGSAGAVEIVRRIHQFTLDTTSEQECGVFGISGKEEGSRIWSFIETGYNNENAFVVFSRVGADGSLQTSTSYSKPTEAFYEVIAQETEDERLDSWNPSADAILKGSLLNA